MHPFYVSVRFSRRLLVSALLLTGSATTQGTPIGIGSDEAESSWIDATGHWLERQRDSLSDAVTDSASGIDSYFGSGLEQPAKANDSYVSVQLRQRFEKAGASRFDFDIRAKLRLPNTKRKLKLTFDSDPDDFDSIVNRRRDQTRGSTSAQEARDTSIIGLGLDDGLGRHWRTSYNAGVKLRLPLDPFARAHLLRTIALGEQWRSHLRQSLSYFHSDGWRTESSVDFVRPLTERLRFQSGSAAQYIHQDRNWELFQSLSLHQRRSPDSTLEYQVGVSGDSRPSLRTSSYWLRTELRHRLYKKWLYGKIAPELFFGRDNSFSPEPILLLELEIYLGKAPDGP